MKAGTTFISRLGAASGGALSRSYATEVTQRHLEGAIAEIKHHPVLKHPFFDYLRTQSQVGFTPLQMQTMHDNYLPVRMETTLALTKVLIAASRQQDRDSVTTLGKIIYDKTGQGAKAEDHATLAETSFNMHSKLFGLKRVNLKKIPQSSCITPETRLFIAGQQQIYASNSYHLILGASFADEFSSDPMMKIYFETLFKPYEKQYTAEDFKKMSEYWVMHMGGMEERHAADLEQNIITACNSKKDVEEVRKGSLQVLNGQRVLLDGILAAMEKAAKMGVIVPVDFPKVSQTTAIGEEFKQVDGISKAAVNFQERVSTPSDASGKSGYRGS